MYLVDTNVWREALLEQERADEVKGFLGRVATENLAMTDFTFHSIGVILGRLDRTEALVTFADEAFGRGALRLVRVRPDDTARLVEAMNKFELDFDDAYQFIAAETYGLKLVSYDSDLDRAPAGRLTPADAAV